jgi:hypothetical protein
VVKFLFMFLLLPLAAAASGIDDALQEAQLTAAAGDSAKGVALIEAEMDPSLPTWQRQRLLYNSGTALLMGKDWEEALARYASLASEEPDSPLLTQALEQNIALARLMHAEQLWKSIEEGDGQGIESYFDLMLSIRLAMADIAKGRLSWCTLAAAEGAEKCPPAAIFDDMEAEAKRLNALASESINAFRLSKATLQTGAAELLAAARVFKNEIGLLEVAQKMGEVDPSVIAAQMSTWNPLWKRIRQESTHEAFDSALSALGEGRLSDSIRQLDAVIAQLEKTLQIVFQGTPAETALQRLLITYRFALAKDPIQYASLKAVQEEQNGLEKIIGKMSIINDEDLIKKSQKWLENGIQASKKASGPVSRFFVEAAMHMIETLRRALLPEAATDAKTALGDAIGLQEFAQRMLSLRGQSSPDKETAGEIDRMIADLQSAVLTSANSFVKAAIAQQKRAFNAPQDSSDRCQCRPWDDVMPLFSAGQIQARTALDLIGAGDAWTAAERRQTRAVSEWKEALAKLREPPKKQEEKKEEEKAGEEPQSFAPLLRHLQEMDMDDRGLLELQEAKGTGEVEKPW